MMRIAIPLIIAASVCFLWAGSGSSMTYTVKTDSNTSVLVTDEQAVSGSKSVKFCDHPNAEKRNYPYLIMEPKFLDGGTFIFSCNLRFEPGAAASVQFRMTPDGKRRVGPKLIFSGGRVVASGVEKKGTYVANSWLLVSLTVGLDKGIYDLIVTQNGGTVLERKGVALQDPAFKKCGWIGIIGSGKRKACFYLDNLSIKRKPEGGYTRSRK